MRPFITSRIPQGTWFVGIDERTAILGDGSRWEVFGLGSVMVRGPDGKRSFRSGDHFRTDPGQIGVRLSR
jgi:hypothetical protein